MSNSLVRIHELANRPLAPLSREIRKRCREYFNEGERVRFVKRPGYYGNLEWNVEYSKEPRKWLFGGFPEDLAK